MDCPKCGRELKPGASLCRGCGHIVDAALQDGAGQAVKSKSARRSGFTQVGMRPAQDLPPPEERTITDVEVHIKKVLAAVDGVDDDGTPEEFKEPEEPTQLTGSVDGARARRGGKTAETAPVSDPSLLDDLVEEPTELSPGGLPKLPDDDGEVFKNEGDDDDDADVPRTIPTRRAFEE